MVGYQRTQKQPSYSTRSTTTSNMDIDNQNRKYAHSSHNQHYHQGSSSSSKPYESRGSRSDRGNSELNMDNEQPRRGSSARHSSSRGTSSRSSSRYTSGSSSQQPPQQGGSGYHQSHHHYQQSSRQPQSQGPTNAPPSSMITPNNNNHHFTPPQSSYGQQSRHEGSSTQPTYPPPAVTSESPPPNEGSSSSQRRPAYLLHRDLVIGKGSYGQVCIASRGEAEGHLSSSSNRSGKRKKFACKCVMLRNDPKYISKLQEEVNVLRELRGHDNVIRLYDVFCVDNELFIITELGRGGDLFHLLTTHPKHGVTEAYAGK